MTNNAPLIIVTCLRDIHMLDLQAQSFNAHYTGTADIYIVVNERDPTQWLEKFKDIEHYYGRFNLKVLFRNQFDIDCDDMHGWDDQQILKLAISQYIEQESYFVLDTQNFLVSEWSTGNIPVVDGKVPYRIGHFALPMTTWREYNLRLEINLPDPGPETMSFCTPIFFKTSLVKSLINSHGSLNKFSWWFRTASRIKSEFILYYQWAEKNGGFLSHHYVTDCWANPYLRDSNSFSQEVGNFVKQFKIYPLPWASINHRAWGDLSDDEYQYFCNMLSERKLKPNFKEFRAVYVDERRLKGT